MPKTLREMSDRYIEINSILDILYDLEKITPAAAKQIYDLEQEKEELECAIDKVTQ